MQNVHIILLVHSQSKVILTKKMQNVYIILLVQSIKGDTDENNAKCAHYTTCLVMKNILFIWYTMHTCTTCSKLIVNIDLNDLHTMLFTLFTDNDEYWPECALYTTYLHSIEKWIKICTTFPLFSLSPKVKG